MTVIRCLTCGYTWNGDDGLDGISCRCVLMAVRNQHGVAVLHDPATWLEGDPAPALPIHDPWISPVRGVHQIKVRKHHAEELR